MKAFRFGLLTAVCALMGTFIGTAQGRTLVKDAHFTLPFEANCGGRILPPGDYTLFVTELDHASNLVYRVSMNGAGKTSAMAAVRSLGPQSGGRSALIVERRGAKYVVIGLDLHSAGLVLKFREVKAQPNLSADRSDRPQEVPILVAEK